MDTIRVDQGNEPQEFWDMVGGKVAMSDIAKKRIKGRKCRKCGRGNPLDCKFCRKCGAPCSSKPINKSISKNKDKKMRASGRRSVCGACGKGVPYGRRRCQSCANVSGSESEDDISKIVDRSGQRNVANATKSTLRPADSARDAGRRWWMKGE